MSGIPDIGAREYQGVWLIVSDGWHGHTADTIILNLDTVSLTVADGLHGHTADAVILRQAHTLVVEEGLHSHTADTIDVLLENALGVEDSWHAHTADSIVLTQGNVLTIEDALHGHIAEEPILTTSLPYGSFMIDGYGYKKSYGRYYPEGEVVENDGYYLCLAHDQARHSFRDKDEIDANMDEGDREG